MLKVKLALAGISIIALLVAGLSLYRWGYTAGVAKEKEIHAQAVIAWQQRTTKIISELESVRNQRNEVLTETIEVIRYVEDPTGCNMDTTLGNELDRLCSEGDPSAC